MAKKQSINARAKSVERKTQQFLWPGTKFAGNAKRPALEDEDLRGDGADGWPLWGEVKNYSCETIGKRGAWVILAEAYQQCCEAIERNRQDWPKYQKCTYPNDRVDMQHGRPLPFSVLWPVGSSKDEQRLVMYEVMPGERMILTLVQFKRLFIDRTTEADL